MQTLKCRYNTLVPPYVEDFTPGKRPSFPIALTQLNLLLFLCSPDVATDTVQNNPPKNTTHAETSFPPGQTSKHQLIRLSQTNIVMNIGVVVVTFTRCVTG